MTQDELTGHARELRNVLEDYKSDWMGSNYLGPPLSRFENARLLGEGTGAPSIHLELPEGTLRIVLVD